MNDFYNGMYRRHDTSYWCHRATGKVQFDPGQGSKHFDPYWALLSADEGILDFYIWLAGTRGFRIQKNRLWGPHISFIKHEALSFADGWGHDFGDVVFFYSNIIRIDNGRHAWLDVWSEQLNDIRTSFGLPAKNTFHLTLGRLD